MHNDNSRASNHSIETSHSRTPESIASSAIATPPSNGYTGFAPSTFTISNKSSASNIASITNITPVVSFSTPPQLSLMLFSNQQPSVHASDSLSLSDNDSIVRSEPVSISRSQSRPESCHSSSLGSAVSTDQESRLISTPIGHGHHSRQFPVSNDSLSSSINFLSSSLPSASATTLSQLSMSQRSSGSKRHINAMSKQHQRSQSSIDSLSKLLPPPSPHSEVSESKVLTGWFKVGDSLQEKYIYLGHVSDGLTVVVVYDPPNVSICSSLKLYTFCVPLTVLISSSSSNSTLILVSNLAIFENCKLNYDSV